MNEPFRVFGHRGACGYEPENTLASLRKALELGAPWVEFDVRVVERTPVLFHDRSTTRRTGVEGVLEEMDLTSVRALDAGNREQIPLLSEALELLQGKAGANIELKGKGSLAPIADEIRAALRRGWSPENLLLSSFDHHKLKAMKELLPEVPRALLSYGDPLFLLESVREVGASSVVMHYDGVSAERVTELHAAGLPVFVYTINTEDELERMKRIGVNGVFCDFPDRALRYV